MGRFKEKICADDNKKHSNLLISVIIPTCNRTHFLSKCLNMLKQGVQSADFNTYEVIVSDDSETNVAFSFIQEHYLWVKCVYGPKKGPAANRNNGAKYATGKWLLFIDDDCVPHYNLLEAYQQAISIHRDIQVFEGLTTVEREQKNFMEESPINTAGGYLWSCNFMIDKYLFNNVLKGFDEHYPYASMEDVDLHYRLKKLGKPVQFLENARVIHPWRLQLKPIEIGEKRFLSMLYFLNKFPEKRKEYNSKYFLQAFLSTFKDIIQNSIRFKFRGFGKRMVVTLMQLYFAIRILVNHHNIL